VAHWEASYDPIDRSVPAARALVTSALSSQSCTTELLDWGALVVSELATNAVLHAHTPFDVTVDIEDDITIAVTDHSFAPVRSGTVDHDDVHGRGLFLVEHTSDAWGVHSDGDSKRVWCSKSPLR
jgi:anti-sigma regulatory factor (Ser/Thr protein kinase)